MFFWRSAFEAPYHIGVLVKTVEKPASFETVGAGSTRGRNTASQITAPFRVRLDSIGLAGKNFNGHCHI
jgi:hypothetical protein